MLGAFWQRRGVEAVAELWTQPVPVFRDAIRRLRVESDRIAATYFPIPIDSDLYRPSEASFANPHVRRMRTDHDFVIFHPCSIQMNRTRWNAGTGQWRGNERLFEGFARFVRANPTARAALVLVEKESPGVREAKALLSALGVSRHVVWLRGPHAHGFARADIIPFYAAADVVAEDFGEGWFGSTTIEGAAMGKPVLGHLDPFAMGKMYPWHPLVAAHSPEEVADRLTALWKEPERRQRIGEESRKWVEEFHAIDRAAARYIEGFRALAARGPTRAIRGVRAGAG